MLETAIVLVGSAHLLAVNFASTAPLLAIVLEWLSTRQGGHEEARGARFLAFGALVALGLGMVLGLVMAGLFWSQLGSAYGQMWRRIPRLGWAAAELGVYVACVGGYLWLVPRQPSEPAPARRWLSRLLALVAGTNLLYHFPPLFTVVAGLHSSPLGPAIDPAAFRRLRFEPLTLALSAHHWLAAFAVGGAGLFWYGWRRWRAVGSIAGHSEVPRPEPSGAALADGSAAHSAARLIRIGGWFALVATLLQWVVGMVLLAQLPRPARDALLGGDALAVLLFVTALTATLGLMHMLAGIALGQPGRLHIYGALILLVSVVVLMVGTLHRARFAMAEQDQSRAGSAWPAIACVTAPPHRG